MKKVDFKIISAKALIYRVIRILSNIILFGAILGNWTKAIALNIGLALLSTTQYFVYDLVCTKYFPTTVQTKGSVIWFTGIPCSGKSTIADALAEKLKKEGYNAERLDGDVVRAGKLCDDLGFSKEDRDKNINRVTFVSKLLSRNNTIVLASFVSPYKKTRAMIRKNVSNFVEVHVCASPEICAKRDVKGMWALAKQGKIKDFTGYNAPYEFPEKPEVECMTNLEPLSESVFKVYNYMKVKGLIK